MTLEVTPEVLAALAKTLGLNKKQMDKLNKLSENLKADKKTVLPKEPNHPKKIVKTVSTRRKEEVANKFVDDFEIVPADDLKYLKGPTPRNRPTYEESMIEVQCGNENCGRSFEIPAHEYAGPDFILFCPKCKPRKGRS